MKSEEFIEYNIEATNNAYLQANPGASASDPNSVRTNAAWRIADDMANPDGTDTDWQDLLFRNALMQSHNLSVSGGSEKVGLLCSRQFFSTRTASLKAPASTASASGSTWMPI